MSLSLNVSTGRVMERAYRVPAVARPACCADVSRRCPRVAEGHTNQGETTAHGSIGQDHWQGQAGRGRRDGRSIAAPPGPQGGAQGGGPGRDGPPRGPRRREGRRGGAPRAPDVASSPVLRPKVGGQPPGRPLWKTA